MDTMRMQHHNGCHGFDTIANAAILAAGLLIVIIAVVGGEVLPVAPPTQIAQAGNHAE